MQSHNHFSFGWRCAKLVFRSASKPPVQRVQIDVENENRVKQIYKAMEIPRAAAKEGDRVASISGQRFDFVEIPKVVFVPKCHIRNALLERRGVERFARLWIAFIGQFAVTVDDVITSALQFDGD